MAAPKKKKSRGLFYVIVVVLALLAFGAYRVFGPNTGPFTEGEYLYIHTGANYEQVVASLKAGGFVADMFSFDFLAKRASLPEHIHAGRYKINKFMSNYNLVRMLRSGRQAPVKLVINKLRTKQDFINLLSANLEADSTEMERLFSDDVYLSQFGLDSKTFMCGVMQDTYDFYWNINGDKAFRKIEKNYARFWDEKRKAEAQSKGLTPTKAMILASVVDEESNVNDDKPKIASVYLNRLKKSIKLQADPTVRFAIGDFTIKRVTSEMLQYQSPYNTYLYEGLPPGPICNPAVSSIVAVLEAPETTYIYFCAKDDLSGATVFATTYDEHQKNARAYQNALNQRGIH